VPIPVPCLGELFHVLTGKAGRSNKQVQEAVLSWMDAFELVDSIVDAWRGAMDLCVAHQLSSWNAPVLTAAAEGAARLLLSEDLNPCCCDFSAERRMVRGCPPPPLRAFSATLKGFGFGRTRWLTPVLRTAVRFRSAPFPRSRFCRKHCGAAMVSTGYEEGD